MGAFEADFLHFVSMSVAKIWNSQLLQLLRLLRDQSWERCFLSPKLSFGVLLKNEGGVKIWKWVSDQRPKTFLSPSASKLTSQLLSINSIEKNTHSTTHPSKLDVTLIRQPISTHKLHQDHYSHTTTVITTAVSQLDCIQPYSYQS